MEISNTGYLVILAGPSCVGKSPLVKALARFHPELARKMQPLVLYNNRDARPGERDGLDYYFRSQDQISALEKKDGFVVMEVRADLQALDVNALLENLKKSDVLFEGNPFIGKVLLTHPALKRVNKLSVFVSPLSKHEIVQMRSSEQEKGLPDRITDIMQGKLLGRTQKQKKKLSDKDLKDIEVRAGSAYTELCDAYLYNYVIPNHDGEDSENWDALPYPAGDAGLALNSFVALLNGKISRILENWEKDLLPHM